MFENLKIYNPSNVVVVLLWVVVSKDNKLVKKGQIADLEFKKPDAIVFTKPRKMINGYYGLKDIMSDAVYKCDTNSFYQNYDIISEEICTLDKIINSNKNLNLEELYMYRSLINKYFAQEIKDDKLKYKQKLLKYKIN